MTAAASTVPSERPVSAGEPPDNASPDRKPRRWLLLLPLLLLLPFSYLLGAGEQIQLDQGLSLRSATLPREVGVGEVLSLAVRFQASQALSEPYYFLVHFSS